MAILKYFSASTKPDYWNSPFPDLSGLLIYGYPVGPRHAYIFYSILHLSLEFWRGKNHRLNNSRSGTRNLVLIRLQRLGLHARTHQHIDKCLTRILLHRGSSSLSFICSGPGLFGPSQSTGPSGRSSRSNCTIKYCTVLMQLQGRHCLWQIIAWLSDV